MGEIEVGEAVMKIKGYTWLYEMKVECLVDAAKQEKVKWLR